MSFKYRNWVFRECSVDVEAPKIGLTGKNGCGKTTFLKLLDRQLTPQEGRIGTDGSTYLVDFDMAAYKAFWLDDIVRLCSSLRSFDTTSASEKIEQLHLAEYTQTPIGELSKGTVRKVSLLIGLMSTADILLLDEPFESIDEDSNNNLTTMLSQRLGAHVIVSHDRTTLRQCVDATWTIENACLKEVE
ncbi:MAG: ATP-binding cassette domain-containing protein [Propionibacteriaceae bacterium]|nr:ATP-binding cassette domain-containing protein [Propionibacteriaceae bacterium]